MLVVYDSLTGCGKQFAKDLEQPTQSVLKRLDQPCILVTRNSGLGQIPWTTKRFIKKYAPLIRGFVMNGDQKRYPKTFCGATDKIREQYGLHHICNIHRSGDEKDRPFVKEWFMANILD